MSDRSNKIQLVLFTVLMCVSVFIGFNPRNETTWLDQVLLVYGGLLCGFVVSMVINTQKEEV